MTGLPFLAGASEKTMEEAVKCTQMLIEVEEAVASLRLKEEGFKEPTWFDKGIIEELYAKAKFAIETRAVEVDKTLEDEKSVPLDPQVFICKQFEMLKQLDQDFERLQKENVVELLKSSIINNNLYLLEFLLVLGADPSFENSWGIRYASDKGFIEIVNCLLCDPRINPTAISNVGAQHKMGILLL